MGRRALRKESEPGRERCAHLADFARGGEQHSPGASAMYRGGDVEGMTSSPRLKERGMGPGEAEGERDSARDALGLRGVE